MLFRSFLDILYYPPTLYYHVIVITMKTIFPIPNYITESCFFKKTNQKKENSISDLLAMVHPERVVFGLSLTSSSSELMNARMTSLQSSFSPRVNDITVILIIVFFVRFAAFSACPVVILSQCPSISQCLLASSDRTLLLHA